MTTPPVTEHLDLLSEKLCQVIEKYPRPVIAYSGGVDSALVALAAHRVWSQKTPPSPAWAVMAVSPSVASGELEQAEQIAAQIGIPFRTIHTREIELSAYRENSPRRCYFCKSTLYSTLSTLHTELQYQFILNGTNVDDLGDYRPGLEAAAEAHVKSPLVEAGLRKDEVRALAKHWGLEIWDKPASPCLASRIVYGLEVTPTRLDRVDQAEAYLKRLTGLEVLRVRHRHDDHATIEIPSSELSTIQQPDIWTNIQTRLSELGFTKVEIDPQGFRSGSLNEVLAEKPSSSS